MEFFLRDAITNATINGQLSKSAFSFETLRFFFANEEVINSFVFASSGWTSGC
jgi:hypothetical protein